MQEASMVWERDTMGFFINGLLYSRDLEAEIDSLSPEDLEILRSVLHYELFTNPEIREALLRRVREVIERLQGGSP
jgi:hypothetical protein